MATAASQRAIAWAPHRRRYTFEHLLDRMVANAPPEAPVLEDESVQLTKAQLVGAVGGLSRELADHLEPESRICSVLPSAGSFVAAQAAVVGIGACFIAVPSDAANLTALALETTCADWLLVDAASDSSQLAARHSELGILALDPRTLRVEVLRPRPNSRRPLRADHSALALVTSGSTGVPKVVAMSEETYCHCALMVAQTLSVEMRDRLLHTLPIQRGAGWFCWAGLASGACNRIQTVRSRDLAETLREWDASGTFTVSTGIHALAAGGEDRASLPRLRTLYYSSGPVTYALKEDIAARFGEVLVQDYAMTEVPEPLAVFSRQDHARGSGHAAFESVGRPVFHDRVGCVDPATSDAPAVVQVRSPWMFNGYWRGGVVEPPSLHNGWLVTDDLGYFDGSGYLHLRGRTSASVRGGGVAFQLSDVLSLVRSEPSVLDARVRVEDDHRLGERVAADIVLAVEAEPNPAAFRERLKEVAPDPRMVPAQINFVSRLETESLRAKDTP